MIGTIGASSEIAKAFSLLTGETLRNFNRDYTCGRMPLDMPRYLVCAGKLYGKALHEMEEIELATTLMANFGFVSKFLDRLFLENKRARVVVIGSESGFSGSYDMAYAGAKAALHLYVEKKKLSKFQHLVCVAPTIIADAGMTNARKDYAETMARGEARRLGRWLNSAEVARIAKFALDEDALCNTVIRATGGNY